MRLICLGAATSWLVFVTAVPAAAQIDIGVNVQDDAVADHEWVASGFGGSTYGGSVDEADAGFGGAVTYLYDRWIGGEFLASFTPDFGFASAPTTDSTVNNYMANAVAALPMGEQGRIQPFVSGGLGAMRLHADAVVAGTPIEIDDTQLASNIGVGLMLFQDRWGIRTDFRYYTGLEDTPEVGDSPIDVLDPNDQLSDTSFWRYNFGVAYRW